LAEKNTQVGGGSDPKKVQVLPDVRAGQVISLVEVTGSLGSTIDASRLADELGADIAVLIPILDTAEMLGLVKSENGDITLTEFGHRFQKTARRKVQMLRELLSHIEPFRTAIELASREGSVSSAEVTDALAERGITWHHEPEQNQSIVQTLLIHWAIYAGLLTYNKDGKFEAKKR
jgi:hypothetical protein